MSLNIQINQRINNKNRFKWNYWYCQWYAHLWITYKCFMPSMHHQIIKEYFSDSIERSLKQIEKIASSLCMKIHVADLPEFEECQFFYTNTCWFGERPIPFRRNGMKLTFIQILPMNNTLLKIFLLNMESMSFKAFGWCIHFVLNKVPCPIFSNRLIIWFS